MPGPDTDLRVTVSHLPVELTRDAKSSDNGPVWSPDGKRIAFWRAPAGNSDPGGALWIMNADGTNPHRVMSEFSGEVFWLSDRNVLVEQGEKVVRLDLATGVAEPFVAPKMRTILAVDRMRQWLAYQPEDAVSMKLFAMPIAGGQGRPVDTGSFDAYHPFFSPSNRWLYFQPAHKNLYRVPGPAQSWVKAEPEKVTDFSGIDLYIDDPKISLDGSKLFYTQGRRTGDIVILRFGNGAEKKKGS